MPRLGSRRNLLVGHQGRAKSSRAICHEVLRYLEAIRQVVRAKPELRRGKWSDQIERFADKNSEAHLQVACVEVRLSDPHKRLTVAEVDASDILLDIMSIVPLDRFEGATTSSPADEKGRRKTRRPFFRPWFTQSRERSLQPGVNESD